MFRLYKAELKKIFLKPSIFVVTGLIILMLAVSTFIYNPGTRTDGYHTYSYMLTTNEYIDSFENGSSFFDKSYNDAHVNAIETYVNHYDENRDVVEGLIERWRNVDQLFENSPDSSNMDYCALYSYWATRPTAAEKQQWKIRLDMKKQELYSAIKGFKEGASESDTKSYNYYLYDANTMFLVTNSLAERIEDHFEHIYSIFNSAEGQSDEHGYLKEGLKNYEAFAKVFDDLNGLLPFEPSQEVIDSYKTTKVVEGETVENENSPIVVGRARLAQIYADIQGMGSDSNCSPEEREAITRLMNNYCATAEYVNKIVEYGIKVSGFSKYTAMDITKFRNFSDANYYEMQEILTKNQYLFDTETYDYDYTEPFSIVQPSNNEINGYDYSYFALRLCAFFITVYIVVLAAGTIAGEQSAGTLKLLAIRPYGRNKLLSSKIWATLSAGAILLFVSSIASMVIGGVTYGLGSASVLVIFNAQSVMVIHPILLYVISVLLMFVEISFYGVLSVFISTVFKSNIAAVSISTLIFFLSLVINVVATHLPLLGIIPFVNVNFFKYFGSSFVAGMKNSQNTLQKILTPTVFSGSTFITSLILYLLTTVVVVIVTHIIFKKRDIR